MVEQRGSQFQHDRVAVLDAGAQYTKVIDRRIRELNVESIVLPLSSSPSELKEYKAIIISGGPGSVNDIDGIAFNSEILRLNVPILGICYGMQLINKEMGGTIEKKDIREDGQFLIEINNDSLLFRDMKEEQLVLLTHGDSIGVKASCLRTIATSGDLCAGIEHETLPIYGLQFHPEVDLTAEGKTMFYNFLFNIAKCKGGFQMATRVSVCGEYIKKIVGSRKVLMLVSGGVDSAVCAALLHKILKRDQVIAIHIDNGFLRKNESQCVMQSLSGIGLDVCCMQAAHRFLTSSTLINSGFMSPPQIRCTDHLCKSINPEVKRKIIGDTFIKVAEEAIEDLNLSRDNVFLGQGTLRPDLIESASSLVSSDAVAIKTHHNDTDLVRELRKQGRVVEPLKDFHKDEVRQMGKELGLPDDLINRHPFPGPGLAIRILCAQKPFVTPDYGETLTKLKFIMNYHQMQNKPHATLSQLQSLTTEKEQNLLSEISLTRQISACLLPIRSVGVQGDGRSYSYVAALSTDEHPQWDHLLSIAKLIPKVCHNINRIVFLFGSRVLESPQDVTTTYLNPPVISLLRECDHIAHSILKDHDCISRISQMSVVLVPLHFDRDISQHIPSCQRSIVLRPFISADFMTGIAAIPGSHIPEKVVLEIVKHIQAVPGISRVMYDLTSKPPGTTEWE